MKNKKKFEDLTHDEKLAFWAWQIKSEELHDDKIVCPYCKNEQEFLEPCLKYIEDNYDLICDYCNKTFEVVGSITWTFITSKRYEDYEPGEIEDDK